MNHERLVECLKKEESCNLERHDVKGTDHIGWGANLEIAWNDDLLVYLGVEDEDDIHSITQGQADYIFDFNLSEFIPQTKKLYADVWDGLTPLRQEILVNLCFNLGAGGLRGFRKMNRAIAEADWLEASKQMLDSKAAKFDAPARYRRLAAAFESDDEAYLELGNKYDHPEDQKDDSLSGVTNQDLIAELGRRLA